jgi:hypothetical protein
MSEKKKKKSPVRARTGLRSYIALCWALILSFRGIVRNHSHHRASSVVAFTWCTPYVGSHVQPALWITCRTSSWGARLLRFACFFSMPVLFAQGATELQNIANGKPYTMSSPPNYSHCTDDGDQTDLTDGVVFEEPDSLWTQKSTVGWSRRRGPLQITLDLGSVEPVRGASYHTAGGEVGVSFPTTIAVQVSEDGKTFYWAGDLVRLDENAPPRAYAGYFYHTYRTDKFQTKGRYVRFEIAGAGEYVFVDEIEVYRGDDAFLEEEYPGEPVSAAQVVDPARLTRLGAYRRIRSDLETTRALVEETAPENQADLLHRLSEIRSALYQSQFPAEPATFKAIVPFNEYHRRVFGIYSHVLPKGDGSGITIWHTPRYKILSLFEKPGEPLSELTVEMMRNEYRAEVFNITNASESPMEIRIRIQDLPGGRNPAYVRPHQVEYVDTRMGEVVATALVPLEENDGAYRSNVAAGMTRQIWLSVNRPDIDPGRHRGRIGIVCGSVKKEIPFTLSIAGTRFPDRPDYSLEMWDYLADMNPPRYGTTEMNRSSAIQDMTEHFVDTVWAEWGSLPQIKSTSGVGRPMWDFDEMGNLTAEIDFSGWDRFVKMSPGARYYMASHHFHAKELFGGLEQGTEAFDRALAQFAARWAEHNREIGLKPRQAGICFVDEPSTPDTFRITYLFAKAFKAGTDEILLWSNPVVTETDIKYFQEAMEHCDIICPNLEEFRRGKPEVRDYYRELQTQGKSLWFYQCGGPTRIGNTAYYRLQPWYAGRYGATGGGFWAYADGGGNMDSWNDYPAVRGTSFTPVYFSSDHVTTSKHWEAAREGIQDWQYLKMLKDRIAELKKSGHDSGHLQDADQLAETLAQSVLDQVASEFGTWYSAKLREDPSAIAENARLKALRMLEKLIP